MSADVVPVIDLSGWFGDDPAARRAVAAAIDDACRTTGFFQITGHRFPPALVERTLAEIDAFFDLPHEAKMLIAPDGDHINRGFLRQGGEALSYSVGVDAPADLREVFVMGPDDVPDDDVHRADPFHVFAPNLWPVAPAGLRPAMTAYFAAVASLAHTLTDIYAVALGLDPDFFRPSLTHSTETLRVNYYERLAPGTAVLDGQQRLGAHTDYGITTVLYADRVPGLQVLGGDGRWYDVVAEPGCFVVNLGDLLAQWTNDQWRSTVHRVVSLGESGTRRRSLAFFLDGNYDAVVECLPTCCDDLHPPKYPRTTAGEHLVEKLRGARTLTKADTIDTVGDRIGSMRRT
jgi:isopenicillin N synthase-like dioxygenase